LADKDFKVKNKLFVNGLSNASGVILATNNNLDSSTTLPTQYGGTGTTTSPNAGQIPYSSSGTNYAPTDLSSLTISSSGGSTITAASASTKGLIIKGAASQTADLQQWQIPNGNKTAWVDGNGQFETGYFFTNFGGGSYKNSGLITVNPANNIVPLVIAGASGQTSDLQQWRNSSGTVLASIDSNGQLRTPQILNIASFNNSRLQMTSTGSLFDVGVASNVVLRVRGAASQTADLQQWQNSSGTLMAAVKADGSFRAGGANGATKFLVDQFGTLSLGTDRNITGTPTYLFVQSQASSDIGAVVKGASGQSVNLQEWQNSAGTVLAKVDSAGGFTAGNTFLTSTSSSTVGLTVTAATGQTSTNIFEVQRAGGGDASFSVSHNYIDLNRNTTAAASMTVYGANAGAVPLYVKGRTSQTVNLQEWQNSSGTVLTKVDSSGIVTATNGFITSASYKLANGIISLGYTNTYTATIGVVAGTPTNETTLIVKKKDSTETGNLQEWQNSAGTVLASISAAGNLTVQDLTVNGTTTTINSTTLTVDDKNIELASVASPTDTTADGAGITIKGATDKTFNWVQSTGAFTSSEPISTPALSVSGNSVSSNITLAAGKRYFVDTTSARTLTLPASPSLGDEIKIFDASGTAATNNITIARNGNKINGQTEDAIIDVNQASSVFVYTGATVGWRFD